MHDDIVCLRMVVEKNAKIEELRENLAFAQQRSADNDLRARIGEDKIRELTAERVRSLEDSELIDSLTTTVDSLKAEVERLRAENADLDGRCVQAQIRVDLYREELDAMRPLVDAAREWVESYAGGEYRAARALIDAVRALDNQEDR